MSESEKDLPLGGIVRGTPQPSPPIVNETQRYSKGGRCHPDAIHDAFPPIGTKPGEHFDGKR